MDSNRANQLNSRFTPLGIWSISIGTSIGWGSFIVTCNAYLQKSGLLGTVFGMLLGMCVIFVITWNLQYMIRTAPNAGGIYTFEKHAGGKDLGFLAFWFVLLTYLAVLWANMTSLPLFARFFLGNTFQFGLHYSIFGYEVWLGEALLSICAVVLIGLFCANSARLPNRVMIGAALTFAAGFTICAVLAIFRHESTFSYSPLYMQGSSEFSQIVRIAAISPWAFIGFENISHFSEEYSFSLKKVRGLLLSSVITTTVLYLFVSLLSVSAYPPEYESWLAYIRDMGNLDGIKAVPAFYAAQHYLGQAGVAVLMLALFSVILTSLIGNLLALSRLLFAAGRENDAPRKLASLNKRGIPARAIFVILAISACVPFLGRTAIGWIVDVTTLGATLIYGLLSFGVYRHAAQEKRRLEKYTGIAGVALMICFMLLLLIPGLLSFDAMESESYFLFIVWALTGMAYYRWLVRRDRYREHGQRVLVWVLFLVLVLFASMMWVSRATENAANTAVERIYQYHQSHPYMDADSHEGMNREAFLLEQVRQISDTNTLYTVVSLGVFLLSVIIMMNNYRDTQVLGQRLSAAEDAARAAQKIAELKQSLTSLMDNMPAMSFSKDAQTGVYLACNQAFARFAHKENPEDVVGLTDDDLFEPITASHFQEMDRVALEMDAPYIFSEDAIDAVGNQWQFQTTKLKFIDESGRLCVLGMCLDMTAMVRTKAAYEKTKKTSIMYSHIAQTLAQSYTDLYYVDLNTEEYIEFRTNTKRDTLIEKRRGWHFFDQCKIESQEYVYSEDQELFLENMDRQALLNRLSRSPSFTLTYRLNGENGPTYVTMKTSRMRDDESAIVIGVSDVDEEIKQRRAAERVKEERIAYARINALTGDFICVYIVVPETGRYREYSTTANYATCHIPKEGLDFFTATRENARKVNHPDDMERFLEAFTKENVMEEIQRTGIFVISYRIIMEGKPVYVRLKAALVDEKEGRRLVVGINDIDSHVRQEEEYMQRLAQAQNQANIDALTGVKNRHAFLKSEEQIDGQISQHRQGEFAIVILDVNDLKKINDRDGHKAGDIYLKTACGIICRIFKQSPVFRIGGDEFVVIAQGNDYERIEELTGKMVDHNISALSTNGILIACGMAKFNGDSCMADVFERADELMYENKTKLKAMKNNEPV